MCSYMIICLPSGLLLVLFSVLISLTVGILSQLENLSGKSTCFAGTRE